MFSRTAPFVRRFGTASGRRRCMVRSGPGSIALQIRQETALPALDMLAGGTTLMLLRLHSDALWLPVGYHWAWNVLQTAVFGASDAAPSIRPLHVHGPERWKVDVNKRHCPPAIGR
jgi:hypothetical protein